MRALIHVAELVACSTSSSHVSQVHFTFETIKAEIPVAEALA